MTQIYFFRPNQLLNIEFAHEHFSMSVEPPILYFLQSNKFPSQLPVVAFQIANGLRNFFHYKAERDKETKQGFGENYFQKSASLHF